MEKMIPNGAPSLVACKKLVVEGDVTFASGVVIKGTVTIKNSGASKEVPAGTYEDTVKESGWGCKRHEKTTTWGEPLLSHLKNFEAGFWCQEL